MRRRTIQSDGQSAGTAARDRHQTAANSRIVDRRNAGTEFALPEGGGNTQNMSLVRLLGFTTLGCGCVVGRYREVATSREVTYVEEKGKACASHGHRRNHTVATERIAAAVPIALATRAS
jgi:hypothetical protein